MRTRKEWALFLRAVSLGSFSALGAAGCSGATSSADGVHDSGADGLACSVLAVPPPPATPAANASVRERAEAEQLAMLDRLFGQYMRGDIIIYRGTMQGNQSIAPPAPNAPPPDEAIPQGTALARLAVQPTWSGDWAPTLAPAQQIGNDAILLTHSLAQGKYMVFDQSDSLPTTTAAGLIVEDNSDNILYTSCSECAPSFWTRPATLTFHLTTGGMIDGITFETMASLDLVAAPPCTVTFDELVLLNGATGPNEFSDNFGLWSFVLEGSEWVWHSAGAVATALPSGLGKCDGRLVRYGIDLYVSARNLGNYGVRNYAEGASEQICQI